MPDMRALQASGKRAAVTVFDYENIWTVFLKAHFNGTQTFANYTTGKARTWLMNLRKKDGTSLYSEAKIRKIKSVAKAIFDHAIELDYLNANEPPRFNPWDAVKMKHIPAVKTKQGDNKAYTEAEVETILRNLDAELGDTTKPLVEARDTNLRNARILLALCFYAGLRDEEAIALRWENVNLRKGTLKVCETVVNDVHKMGTKTGEDRVLEYLTPLASILTEWHREQGSPTSGLVVHKKGDYVSPKHLASEIVKPNCKKHGIEWAGWYAARRGCGTHMYLINVPIAKAAKYMGNTPDVYVKHYVKDNGEGSADVARIDREHRAAKAQTPVLTEQKKLQGELAALGLGDGGQQ
jgi:integrase